MGRVGGPDVAKAWGRVGSEGTSYQPSFIYIYILSFIIQLIIKLHSPPLVKITLTISLAIQSYFI